MRFGLALPHYGFSHADGRGPTIDRLIGWGIRAEELGFDSVWVSDHLFYSFGRYGADPSPIAALEPMTSLAALAAVTQRVRLGTLVLCASFRHPAMIAKEAAGIDQISGGRFELGLGAGWLRDEFEAFGFPFGEARDRFEVLEDALRVVDGLRRGVASVEGRTRLRAAALLPPPVQRPMPLFVGGKGGPRLLRLAARYADGWNTVWRMSPREYARRLDGVRAACEAEGRDQASFRLTVGLYSLVGEGEDEARRAFERGRATFPGGAMAGETWESWRADTLSGSREQVLDRVVEFEAMGVEELIVSPWVLPFAAVEPDQIEGFARGVLGA